MSDRWGQLRDRFKTKDIDLDAEFEKFLNESMSDESSMGSPRLRTPDLKSKSKKDQMPWWAEEDGAEEEKKREAARESWMKPKISDTEIKQQQPDDVDTVTMPTAATPQVPAAKDSAVTPLTGSYANTSGLSISKDSLEEGLAKSSEKTRLPPEELLKRLGSEDFEDTLTYSDEPRTGATTSPSSPIPKAAAAAGPVSVGLDTMNEVADKERFFDDVEVGMSSVDYRKKLNEITSSESLTQDRKDDERFQATGAELGESIFNMTDASEPNRGVAEVEEEREDEYSDHFEDAHSPEDIDSREIEELPRSSPPERPDVVKPSMLSKVSLMESLDSTLDTKRPAAALGLPTKLNKPQVVVSRDKERQRQNDENFESKEEMSPTLRTGPDYAASGSTRDIQELQAALRAAQLTATGTGSKYSAAESFDEPEPAHIVLEKNAQGQTRAHGFDLQPVVVTNDWSTKRDEFNTQSNQQGELSSLVTVDEARGFGLNPVRVGNQFTGSVQESAEGLVSGTAEPRGLDPKSAVPAPTKGRGFDLQPAVDARGFGLQSVAEPSGFDLKPATLHGASIYPSEGGRGFDLQATEERHGFNLQPVANLLEAAEEEEDDDDDTPPPESLQSIKNIARARKSAGRESVKKSTEKTPATKKTTKIAKEGSGKKGTSKEKAPQKKGKGKVASSTDRSRLYQPSPSSAPSWSPTPTMRSSRPNSKKSFGASKKLNLEIPASSKMADTSPSTEHLAASVESFANYLKHFVRPENDENETPPARWSNDEPSKSTSRTSFRRPSEDGRLSRERALQAELENWQLAWKDEKKRNDKLIADVASREKEWSRREEKCRLQYESQIHELKQELFVMQTKLNETEKEADVRRRLAAGGNLEDVSEEELKKLEKEVREQEQLLTGYQQENERLYKELKQMQAKEKASEARMFSENQKLASELANLKEKIERRESAGPGTDLPVPGSAALGADKISVLTREMKTLRRRVTEVQDEAEELRRAKHEMETRLRGVENERDTVVKQNSQAFGSNASELAEIEGRHAAEVERLRNKLKWYAETQSLLDRDVLTLRKKEEEISELRETVARLQTQHGQSVVEKKQRGAERASDAKRIQDLERQVREMEEIIRRRYPNSLPALIYAAASAPGQAQPVTNESPKKQSPTYAFLENRVRKLETELENKDEEASKRIRSIEQRYIAIRLEYDDRIRDLEKELQIANERCEDFSKTNTHKSVFEEELQAVREANNQEVKKLQTEIQVLQDALSKATALESASAKVRSKKRLELETRDSEDQSSAVQALRDKLENKELELEGLRQTCNRLQREREQMLVSDTKRVDRQTSPQPDPPIAEELIRENKQLKEHLSQTSLDMDQQRIRFQGSLAEAERSARLAREEAADQLSSLQAQCKREVDQLKAEFAVNHGASKVTELKSQLAGQEIVIQRLKAKLAGASVNVETMAASKVREESLQQQVVGLQADLKRAKDMFSPQMNHFDALETKIVSLEQRHFQRELDLKRIIEKTQLTASIEKEESEARWRQVLRQKNREIEKFRCELDAILEVLSELKRQGVVIPIRNGEKFVP